MSSEVIRYPSDLELARAAAADWLKHLAETFAKGGPKPFKYSVALSGGRITKAFFKELVAQFGASPAEFKNSILPGLHFFWADERCVPPTDPENNYLMAKELLFEPLGIKSGQIHRIRGEADEIEAVVSAIHELKATATMVEGRPVLDMVFLGMGEDGHVASLFPGEPEEFVKNPAIFRAVTAVKPPPRRVTLGYSTIIAARNVWVLASGKGKEIALQGSLSATGITPLGKVLAGRSFSKVLTDIH